MEERWERERGGGVPTEVAALLDLSDFLVIVSQVWRTGGGGTGSYSGYPQDGLVRHDESTGAEMAGA